MPIPDISDLTGDEVDQLIARILTVRPTLKPEHALEPPAHSLALADPRWRSFLDATSGMTILRICHPALGWLDFALPPVERAKLAGTLVTQGLIPPTAPQPSADPGAAH